MASPPKFDLSPGATISIGPGWGIASLFAALYFVQGISEPTEGLIAQPVRSLLRNWNLTTAQISTFSALVALPWALKPLYAVLSDFVPLFGTRRRSYLLLTTFMATAGLIWLYCFPVPMGASGLLLLLLLIPTVGVAFSDVLIDALMIEKGQPLGLTGRLQSIQWGAMYLGTIVTGILGGYLSQHGQQQRALLICGLLLAISWVLVLVFASEPVYRTAMGQESKSISAVWKLMASSKMLSVGAFVFLWSFNPFASSILYMHMTKHLHLSEQFYGYSVSFLAAGAFLATVLYGFVCRKLSHRQLLHISIIAGISNTAAYWFIREEISTSFVSVFVGFAYMFGSLVLYDIAAQVCPLTIAATAFACLMSLSNVSLSLSAGLGGILHDQIESIYGHSIAFNSLVGIGAGTTALCWLVVPWLIDLSVTPSLEPENHSDAAKAGRTETQV